LRVVRIWGVVTIIVQYIKVWNGICIIILKGNRYTVCGAAWLTTIHINPSISSSPRA
jgi:hypothetical protein